MKLRLPEPLAERGTTAYAFAKAVGLREEGGSSVRPGRWLAIGGSVSALVYALAAVSALGLTQHALVGARVPRGSVTGRALAATGDSGVFASPVLPAGVHP